LLNSEAVLFAPITPLITADEIKPIDFGLLAFA